MNFIKIAVIIAFVLATIFTVMIHPEIHQPMILEDADFVLTRISDTITTENIPVAHVNQSVQQEVKKVEIPVEKQTTEKAIEIYNQKQEKNIQQPKITTKEVKIQEQPSQNKATQMELLQRVLKNSENAQVVKPTTEQKTTTVSEPKTPKQTQITQTPPKQEPVQQKTVQTPQPKSNTNPYMTEEEEIIAWNVWRSNIQNQIMRDSNIDFAPLGTVFSFTFIVDKFGNVSNIKVDCSNPNFMDVARNNVKPAISRLQKKPILVFPKGTQRTSTIVTGVFVIGTQERYSTPDNYSDYERVVR